MAFDKPVVEYWLKLKNPMIVLVRSFNPITKASHASALPTELNPTLYIINSTSCQLSQFRIKLTCLEHTLFVITMLSHTKTSM